VQIGDLVLILLAERRVARVAEPGWGQGRQWALQQLVDEAWARWHCRVGCNVQGQVECSIG
jgi:hypothetical protein